MFADGYDAEWAVRAAFERLMYRKAGSVPIFYSDEDKRVAADWRPTSARSAESSRRYCSRSHPGGGGSRLARPKSWLICACL